MISNWALPNLRTINNQTLVNDGCGKQKKIKTAHEPTCLSQVPHWIPLPLPLFPTGFWKLPQFSWPSQSCILPPSGLCLLPDSVPTLSLPQSWVLSLIHTSLFSACCPERALLLARHPTVVPTQCWWISNLEVHFHSCRHYKIPLGACPASAQNRLHLLGKWAPVSTTQLPSSPPCVPYW